MNSKLRIVSCRTTYLPQAIEANESLSLYTILRDIIEWEEGVRSRSGFTRKAKALLFPESYPLVFEVIQTCLEKITNTKYDVLGVYLNYYENGQMYTPCHSHKGTHQLVISLGATRTLKVAKKSYSMNSGDAILFGSATHGVPLEPYVSEGRISIATFMVPI